MIITLNQFLTYTHKTNASICMNFATAIDHVANKLISDIGYVNLVSFKVSHDVITITTKTSVDKYIHGVSKLYQLKYTSTPSTVMQLYTYVIHVKNPEHVMSECSKSNIKNLQNRYLASVQYKNDLIKIKHDLPLNDLNMYGNMNIRIENKGTDSMEYYSDIDLPEEARALMQNMLSIYVSKPILMHNANNNIISNITRNDKTLQIQLSETPFFIATELYKDNQYAQVVIEIDGKIYGRTTLGYLTKQTIQLTFANSTMAEKMHKALLNPIYAMNIENTKTTNENIWNQILLLIALLLLCLYLMFSSRKYLRTLLLISSTCALIYFFKSSVILLSVLIGSLVILHNSNLYIRFIYTVVCAMAYIYMGNIYNNILLHELLYAIIYLFTQKA